MHIQKHLPFNTRCISLHWVACRQSLSRCKTLFPCPGKQPAAFTSSNSTMTSIPAAALYMYLPPEGSQSYTVRKLFYSTL